MSNGSDTRAKVAGWLVRLGAPVFPALLACFKIVNGDIGFHVATGRAIGLLGHVPRENVLSFAEANHTWVLHQWLPALLFERIDTALGPSALVVVKVAVIYVTFLLLWMAIERRNEGEDRWLPLLWFALAASAAACRFYVRPYIFSTLGMALFLYLTADYRRTGKVSRLVVAAIATGIFASLHAGVVYILLLFLSLATAGALAFAVSKRDPATRKVAVATCISFVTALILSGIAAAIESPWGVEALTLPFRFSTNEYFHAHLVEFRPPPLNLEVFPFYWLLLAAGGFFLLFRVYQAFSNRRNSPDWFGLLFETLALLGFGYLSLKHQRLVFPFALVAGFVLAGWTGDFRAPRPRLFDAPRPRLFDAPRPRRWVAGLAGLAAVVVAAGGMFVQFTNARPGVGVDDRYYPARIFDFIEAQDLPGEAYVSDGWGGQWLWRFYPDRRVFYDNRLEAYSFEFFREQYQGIRYGEEGWQEKLEHYKIDMLVLKYSTAGERRFQEGRPNIRDLAFESPAWRLVFWDDLGEVFVRADTEYTGCASCPDYRAFNPDTLNPAPGVEPGVVAAELAAVWRDTPSARGCFGLSMATLDLGDVGGAVAVLREGLERFPDSPLLLRLAGALTKESREGQP